MITITAPSPVPPGLIEAIEAAGIAVSMGPDGWHVSDATGAQTVINGYNGLATAQSQALATVAAQRWAVMTGGHTTAAGVALKTDTDAMTLITGLFNAANLAASVNPTQTFSFKDAVGTWQSLTIAQVQTLYGDVSMWVQACFDAEGALDTQIKAASTWQAVQAINLMSGWPANS